MASQRCHEHVPLQKIPIAMSHAIVKTIHFVSGQYLRTMTAMHHSMGCCYVEKLNEYIW